MGIRLYPQHKYVDSLGVLKGAESKWKMILKVDGRIDFKPITGGQSAQFTVKRLPNDTQYNGK
jgi:hypothetical protein